MNMIWTMQLLATVLMLTAAGFCAVFGWRSLRLRRLFHKEYIKVLNLRGLAKLYPLVPQKDSKRYRQAKRFLTAIGWNISVEGMYLLKWCLFATAFFVMVTIQTTDSVIALKDIIQDINYRQPVIETLKEQTPERIKLEQQLYTMVDSQLAKSDDVYRKSNKGVYLEYIQNLLQQGRLEAGDQVELTAQRLYYKVLETRLIRNGAAPYVYILLLSVLLFYMPDILGQIKRKLIEDKKNWEILNCMIVFSIFSRLPPYSVQNVLEHTVMATEVYRPLLETLIEGLKKGGSQEQSFDAALAAVDRDELYELIETMKLSKSTGMVEASADVEDIIANTIKWIEIENITRRRNKMLYAMSAVAVVMALGCIYFAFGLTVISNPANMLMK